MDDLRGKTHKVPHSPDMREVDSPREKTHRALPYVDNLREKTHKVPHSPDMMKVDSPREKTHRALPDSVTLIYMKGINLRKHQRVHKGEEPFQCS